MSKAAYKCTGFVHCTSSQHVELNTLSAFEHPVERCWAVLSLVESNLKLVKLFAQHGSTFPLFRGHPCVVQQSRVHLHSNAQQVEPTQAQWPAYPLGVKTYFYKMESQELEVLQESSNEKNSKRGKTRKWTEEETEKLIDLLEKNTT